MKVLRTLAHAIIILGVLLVLARFLGGTPGFARLFGVLGWASFVPFSLSCAAGINNQRAVVIITVIATLLAIWPASIEKVAQALVPIGLGILAGVAMKSAFAEAKEEDGEPVQRPSQ
jgi:hypothetical protein